MTAFIVSLLIVVVLLYARYWPSAEDINAFFRHD